MSLQNSYSSTFRSFSSNLHPNPFVNTRLEKQHTIEIIDQSLKHNKTDNHQDSSYGLKINQTSSRQSIVGTRRNSAGRVRVKDGLPYYKQVGEFIGRIVVYDIEYQSEYDPPGNSEDNKECISEFEIYSFYLTSILYTGNDPRFESKQAKVLNTGKVISDLAESTIDLEDESPKPSSAVSNLPNLNQVNVVLSSSESDQEQPAPMQGEQGDENYVPHPPSMPDQCTIEEAIKDFTPRKEIPKTHKLKVHNNLNLILFNSNFEGGNLKRVVSLGEDVYELFLEYDYFKTHYTQWYQFSIYVSNIPHNTGVPTVSNILPDVGVSRNSVSSQYSTNRIPGGRLIKFRIKNLMKSKSLYESGMKPFVFSMKKKAYHNLGWHHDGIDITYKRNFAAEIYTPAELKELNMPIGMKQYELEFTYKAEYEGDIIFFSHFLPYSQNDLHQYLGSKVSEHPSTLRVDTLCNTLGGNNCYSLTITNNVGSYLSPYDEAYLMQKSKAAKLMLKKRLEIYEQKNDHIFKKKVKPGQEKRQESDRSMFETNDFKPYLLAHRKKKIIFLTCRVHPGETNASHVLEGIINILLSNTKEGNSLRNQYIFKIIPMLNPDGVVYGNYRCSLAGVDLNRQWQNPDKTLHPTIYYTKELLTNLNLINKVGFFCDIHGHSRKMNSFMYGCNFTVNSGEVKKNSLIKIFPYVLSQKNKLFNFQGCSFAVEKDKESTARIVVFKELGIPQVYTLEISFYGAEWKRERMRQEVELEFGITEEVEQEMMEAENEGEEAVQPSDLMSKTRRSQDSVASSTLGLPSPGLTVRQRKEKFVKEKLERFDIHFTREDLLQLGEDFAKSFINLNQQNFVQRKLQQYVKSIKGEGTPSPVPRRIATQSEAMKGASQGASPLKISPTKQLKSGKDGPSIKKKLEEFRKQKQDKETLKEGRKANLVQQQLVPPEELPKQCLSPKIKKPTNTMNRVNMMKKLKNQQDKKSIKNSRQPFQEYSIVSIGGITNAVSPVNASPRYDEEPLTETQLQLPQLPQNESSSSQINRNDSLGSINKNTTRSQESKPRRSRKLRESAKLSTAIIGGILQDGEGVMSTQRDLVNSKGYDSIGPNVKAKKMSSPVGEKVGMASAGMSSEAASILCSGFNSQTQGAMSEYTELANQSQTGAPISQGPSIGLAHAVDKGTMKMSEFRCKKQESGQIKINKKKGAHRRKKGNVKPFMSENEMYKQKTEIIETAIKSAKAEIDSAYFPNQPVYNKQSPIQLPVMRPGNKAKEQPANPTNSGTQKTPNFQSTEKMPKLSFTQGRKTKRTLKPKSYAPNLPDQRNNNSLMSYTKPQTLSSIGGGPNTITQSLATQGLLGKTQISHKIKMVPQKQLQQNGSLQSLPPTISESDIRSQPSQKRLNKLISSHNMKTNQELRESSEIKVGSTTLKPSPSKYSRTEHTQPDTSEREQSLMKASLDANIIQDIEKISKSFKRTKLVSNVSHNTMAKHNQDKLVKIQKSYSKQIPSSKQHQPKLQTTIVKSMHLNSNASKKIPTQTRLKEHKDFLQNKNSSKVSIECKDLNPNSNEQSKTNSSAHQSIMTLEDSILQCMVPIHKAQIIRHPPYIRKLNLVNQEIRKKQGQSFKKSENKMPVQLQVNSKIQEVSGSINEHVKKDLVEIAKIPSLKKKVNTIRQFVPLRQDNQLGSRQGKYGGSDEVYSSDEEHVKYREPSPIDPGRVSENKYLVQRYGNLDQYICDVQESSYEPEPKADFSTNIGVSIKGVNKEVKAHRNNTSLVDKGQSKIMKGFAFKPKRRERNEHGQDLIVESKKKHAHSNDRTGGKGRVSCRKSNKIDRGINMMKYSTQLNRRSIANLAEHETILELEKEEILQMTDRQRDDGSIETEMSGIKLPNIY